MMLIWRMGIVRSRRWWPVLGNWSYLWRRAIPSSIGRHGPLWCAMHRIRRKRHRTRTRTRRILGAIIGSATLRSLLRWYGRWLRWCLVASVGSWRHLTHSRGWGRTPNGCVTVLLLVSQLLRARAQLPRYRRWAEAVTLIVGVRWLGLRLRVLDLSQTATPIMRRAWWPSRPLTYVPRRGPRRWRAPLRPWGSANTSSLVLLWMHILRYRCTMLIGHSCGLATVAE